MSNCEPMSCCMSRSEILCHDFIHCMSLFSIISPLALVHCGLLPMPRGGGSSFPIVVHCGLLPMPRGGGSSFPIVPPPAEGIALAQVDNLEARARSFFSLAICCLSLAIWCHCSLDALAVCMLCWIAALACTAVTAVANKAGSSM